MSEASSSKSCRPPGGSGLGAKPRREANVSGQRRLRGCSPAQVASRPAPPCTSSTPGPVPRRTTSITTLMMPRAELLEAAVLCCGAMTLQRMDNVLINVEDLEAAKAFFAELGMELDGETTVEGPWAGKVIGLDDVRAD